MEQYGTGWDSWIPSRRTTSVEVRRQRSRVIQHVAHGQPADLERAVHEPRVPDRTLETWARRSLELEIAGYEIDFDEMLLVRVRRTVNSGTCCERIHAHWGKLPTSRRVFLVVGKNLVLF